MTEVSLSNRQNVLSRDAAEIELRVSGVDELVHDIIGPNEEFFSDSQNRLDFIQGQDGGDFLKMAQYVNAKLRGEKPHRLRHDPTEKGGFLPMLHTPSHQDKPAAFRSGYEAIQEYIRTSSDGLEKKVEGVAIATEALVIWVHPFNDGNGRTSRFLGRLIEDGAVDISGLVRDTAVKGARNRLYDVKYATRESRLASANNENIMWDDDEREELRESAKSLPSDVAGMGLSIRRLLENDEVRKKSLRYTEAAKQEASKISA